ncbi:copper homeostasis protein CutC [Nocardioides sp.]|uniref:copper homeostasis protein CutC n=1 Tax=Nocardioides sp. TaxID=35761 RepID=UPI003517A236
MRPLLEVVVRHPRDVPGALDGGADRLSLEQPGADLDLAGVSAVVRAAGAVPVRLRFPHPPPDDLGPRLAAVRGLGVAGVGLGLVDEDLEVDVAAGFGLREVAPDLAWTFEDDVDRVLDPVRAWRRLRTLPGLTAVATAGAAPGRPCDVDALLAHAADPAVAALLMPAGEWPAEAVPWLVRAGVRQFRVGDAARVGGSERAYVDAGRVRSWRLLLDHEAQRA